MASSAELLGRLLRQSVVLTATVLLGVLGGALYAKYKTPVYSAEAHVVVVATPPADDATAVKFAQAYGRIATDFAVLSGTTAAVRGGSLEDLRGRVRVSTSPDAPLIQLTGSAPTPAGAAEVANGVASSLIAFANARSGQTRVRLASFAEAAPPERQSSPNLPLNVAVGASAGLLVGGFAVTAGIGARRRRRKDRAGGAARPGAPVPAPRGPGANGLAVGHDLPRGRLDDPAAAGRDRGTAP